MIVINRISIPICYLYGPDNTFISKINEYEFNDIRVQIKEQQAEDYYCKFLINNKDEILKINKDGHCDNWKEGMFDQNVKNLNKLFNI